jgi:hypothetical protein
MSGEKRRKYQRQYRMRKKERKDAEEYETRINNLIQNLDCTRKEAEEIIKADSLL